MTLQPLIDWQVALAYVSTVAPVWVVGAFVAALVFQADLNRRRIRANAFWITALAGTMGLIAAFGAFRFGFADVAARLGWFVMIVIIARRKQASMLEFLDTGSTAAAAWTAANLLGIVLWNSFLLTRLSVAPSVLRDDLTRIYFFLAWLGIVLILWWMGSRATLGPKPSGEIFSVYLLLGGMARFISRSLRPDPSSFHGLSTPQITSALTFLAGGILLWWILARYHNVAREHRILQHVADRGEILQAEYSQPTPECPNPERWHMYDSMTAEVEVLDFLKTLVTTIKPELVVETGTFLGISTLRIAEGLRENGFGRVITCELDPKVYEESKKRFAASGLAEWIDLRNESSLEMKVEGRIDLLYCDSDLPLREQEVRRFLPQMNPHGLILMHDASSDLKIVRDGALKLESEGLISVVLLPTPRGLVVAQKREGRK